MSDDDRLGNLVRILHAISDGRGVEVNLLLGDVVGELTHRGQVVENPKGPAVGRDHQIVVFDDQVVNGGAREIQLQRAPIGTIVE